MKWKSSGLPEGYVRKVRTDEYGSMSVYSCILMYRKLMKTRKISINGSASKRLMVLEYRFQNGERVFRK
jgi:hypothetical protein